MNSGGACDADGITMKFVKSCFDAIAHVILCVINTSLVTGTVPAPWKLSVIQHIYKSAGALTDPSSFRPISLVPCLSKIIERLVHEQLCSFFVNNCILAPAQHGFRRNYSTETALIQITDRIHQAMDQGHICLLVLLDPSKYFDVVNHAKLLQKLELYGVNTEWFQSYLSDHFRYVRMSSSQHGQVTSKSMRNPIGVYCDGVTFCQTPTTLEFSLLQTRRAACRPSRPLWSRGTPSPLLTTPAQPSQKYPPFLPTPPDASQLTPKTATDRHRRQHFSYRLWARQQAAVQVTEDEYAVNTSKKNTTPPSASLPLPQTRVCRHQHRAYWSRQTAHVQTATSSPRSREADPHTTAESWHQITRGEPPKTSASVLVTGHAERAVGRKRGAAQQPAITTGCKTVGGGANRAWTGRWRGKKTVSPGKYFESGSMFLYRFKPPVIEKKQNTKQFKPPTKNTTGSREQHRPGKASYQQPEKILTLDENKTQTDGTPKTNGRDIRSARRWNDTDWSRRALTSVPPGTEISLGFLPRQAVQLRVASATDQCRDSTGPPRGRACPGGPPSDYFRRQTSSNWGDCQSASRPNNSTSSESISLPPADPSCPASVHHSLPPPSTRSVRQLMGLRDA